MSKIFTLEKLYEAYLDCRKTKRKTINALKFEWNLERNLFQLYEELKTKKYRPGRSICFAIKDPVPREIFAATFKDRIVHHVLINELDAIGERAFIHDSYSCRKGKGTHKAIDRLQSFIKKVTSNCTNEAYYLQLDISGFFMSIDHNILYAILKKLILKQKRSYQWKKDILWLSKKIIFYDPTKNYVKKGDSALFDLIPSRKSLFKTDIYKGLPIGNYSSQFFANLYMNELDQFIKRELRQKYYLRYVDDFIILNKHKKYLNSLIQKIEQFLKKNLNLKLNSSKTKLRRLEKGIDFLGYFVKPRYVLVRKRVINTLKNKLYYFKQNLKQIDSKQMQAVINSYLGHFQHADSYNLRKSIYKSYSLLFD